MTIRSIIEDTYKNRQDVSVDFTAQGVVHILIGDPKGTESFIHGNTFYPAGYPGSPESNQYADSSSLIDLIEAEIDWAPLIQSWIREQEDDLIL
jgi:hypothetical protein